MGHEQCFLACELDGLGQAVMNAVRGVQTESRMMMVADCASPGLNRSVAETQAGTSWCGTAILRKGCHQKHKGANASWWRPENPPP